MPSDIAKAGFVRMSELMVRMMDASEAKDKEGFFKHADSFLEDAADLVAVLCEDAGITDDEMDKHADSIPDSQLIKEASLAPQMQKEAREKLQDQAGKQ